MKKVFIIISVLLILLVCAFALVNSGFFVKRVVIPIVASSVGADITVEDVDFSIFKGFQLSNFKVEVTGEKLPPLKGDIARVRYRFLPLLKGKIHVEEVVLENTSVHIIEDKNGILNIPGDPSSKSDSQPQEEKEESELVIPYFEIKNVGINNLTLMYEREASAESPKMSAMISGLTFSLDTLAPGQTVQIKSQCSVSSTVNGQLNARADLCTLSMNGRIRDDLLPESLNLSLVMEESAGAAGPITLDGRVIKFELGCSGDGNKYNLEKCEFSEAFEGRLEGYASLNGEITIGPAAADLNLEMKTNGSGFLDLIGGIIGDYKFGNTEVQYSGNLKVSDNTSFLALNGDLKVTDFSVTSESKGISGLKSVNSNFTHNITYDQERQLVNLEQINMVVTDTSSELMTLVLSEPTIISLEQSADTQDTLATVNLEVKDFNLEFIKPLIPKSSTVELKQGILNNKAELKIYGGGKLLELNGKTNISSPKS